MMIPFEEDHIVMGAHLNEAGEFEVIRKYPSHMSDGTGSPCPDRVVKEIYHCSGSRIVLALTLHGTHKPAYMVRETIVFDA